MQTTATCEYVQQNLSAYYDKELNEKEFLIIQQHLRICISCRREFSNMAKMSYQLSKSFANISVPITNINLNKIPQCHYVMDNLDGFIDKELHKKDIAKISEHLLNCKDCRQDYEDAKNMKKALYWYFEIFKIPENVFSCRKTIHNALRKSKRSVAIASVACLAGAIFLMLLSMAFFSADNINPPAVAKKDIPSEKNIKINDKHEIKVHNIKLIESLSTDPLSIN